MSEEGKVVVLRNRLREEEEAAAANAKAEAAEVVSADGVQPTEEEKAKYREIIAQAKRMEWSMRKLIDRLTRACDGNPVQVVVRVLAQMLYDGGIAHGMTYEGVKNAVDYVHQCREEEKRMASEAATPVPPPDPEKSLIVSP